MFDLHEAPSFVVRNEGSDLHLKVSSPPIARIHGQLRPLEQNHAITVEDTDHMVRQILEEEDRGVRGRERDRLRLRRAGSRALPPQRVPAARRDSIAMRVVPLAVRTVAELGLLPGDLGARRRGARADPDDRNDRLR
jgi:Tfp pilus assembly pilus retraction ATPase PilT